MFRVRSRLALLATMLTAAFLMTGCSTLTDQQTDTMPDENLASLQNTYWKLITLNGQPVQMSSGQREAHLILKLENRVQGYSGCNAFRGKFSQQAETLSFGPIMMTRRACLPDNHHESVLMQLMQGDVSWSISGEQLDLHNPTHKLNATFQAVYLQ